MTDIGTLPGDVKSIADDINASGQVVGVSRDKNNGERAFLYSNGVIHDLNSMLTPGSGWQLLAATAINDSGVITGDGIGPDGNVDGFLLLPQLDQWTGMALTIFGATARTGSAAMPLLVETTWYFPTALRR